MEFSVSGTALLTTLGVVGYLAGWVGTSRFFAKSCGIDKGNTPIKDPTGHVFAGMIWPLSLPFYVVYLLSTPNVSKKE